MPLRFSCIARSAISHCARVAVPEVRNFHQRQNTNISDRFCVSFTRIATCSERGMAQDFNRLLVFRMADALVVDIYELTRLLPQEERFGLQSQIRRAAVSVPTNIVEGSVRRTDRHFLRYLESALGSACEVRYLVGLCVRVGRLSPEACDAMLERYTEVIKALSALIARIEADLKAKRATSPYSVDRTQQRDGNASRKQRPVRSAGAVDSASREGRADGGER